MRIKNDIKLVYFFLLFNDSSSNESLIDFYYERSRTKKPKIKSKIVNEKKIISNSWQQ